jgi:hypothetical protein
MDPSERLDLIKRAAKHAKDAAEVLLHAAAVQSFEDERLVDFCGAADEIKSLSRKFEMEIGYAMLLLDQYMKTRQTVKAANE